MAYCFLLMEKKVVVVKERIMKIYGNPFVVARLCSIFIIFSAVLIFIGMIYQGLIETDKPVSEPWVYLVLSLTGPLTIGVQVYAWLLQKYPTKSVQYKVFGMYGFMMVGFAFLANFQNLNDFFFVILGLGFFSMLAAALVIAVREIDSLEKVGPGESYEIKLKND